ncbi:hypothetical protein LR004_00555 [Candidatus Gracilibacteria bacterium]|nr:hypothetical protein [Candidatus Gracilibacteria bacterium]
MISYLIKIFVLVIFSALIIANYYYGSETKGAHIENFDGYIAYILPMLFVYIIYKALSIFVSKKNVTLTPLRIALFFLVQLLFLSVLFFSYTGSVFGVAIGNGLNLFFKILYFSILPVTIIIITTAFGFKVLGSFLNSFKTKSKNYRFISSVGVGFFLFIFLLTLAGLIGLYNLYSVFIILLCFSILSYKQLLTLTQGIFTYEISLKNHEVNSKNILSKIAPKLLTAEFFFIVISLILSVNLISIMRPFPIGWDDLGAYMNYAHLMANSGSVGELGSMMSWQTFTGIGYLFNNPTQAFFLNSVGGFVSVIVIILIISEIFKDKKKTFIHLPLLAATLFISMPMIVFQQAKDMKLDAGLFFISITALYMLFEFYTNYRKNKEEKKLLSKTEVLKIFFIVGLLLGFTFTIKFTSLLFISAVFGVLFYTRLGILGFFGYLSIYFAIFTAGGLWKMMNVIALDTPEIKTNLSIISLIVGIAFLITARIKTKKKFRRFIPRITSLFVGIIVAILPWGINNIYSTLSSDSNLGVSALISGKAERFDVDYSKIYSESELKTINSQTDLRGLTSSGTTTNEDFGRYFGYEEGINNYVKLPWNLTMQNNQGGEFTTIGFLFLALLPTVFLFLPFRRKVYSLGIYGLIFFEILLFVIPVTNQFFTELMTSIHLPYGYIFILLLALIPLIFFIPTLQKKDLSTLFKINLIFTIFYSLLWGVSAFGVVWYGVVMYFNFILMIIFGAYYLGSYKENEGEEKLQIKFFGSLVFLGIIGIYIFWSVFPHTFNNLKAAGYKEYKMGEITVAEASYIFHPEYLSMLYNMNINSKKAQLFINDSIDSEQIMNIIKTNKLEDDIVGLKQMLTQVIQDERINDVVLKKSAYNSLQKIYKNISKPKPEYKNTTGIYRIGTFLKYHISENNKRLLEDSLITKFNTYIYDKNADVGIERMKKLGINYLLVDLNAATIDQDPRHALTTRYEKLLSTFTSSKLELVETDSVCLKMALEEYKTNKNLDEYLQLAGVNYDGYTDTNNAIKRRLKQTACYTKIIGLINSKKISETSYPYLAKYIPHLAKLKTENEKILFIHRYLGHGYKALFKIK